MKYSPKLFIIFIIGSLIGIVIAIYHYNNDKTHCNHKQDYTLDVYTDTIYDYVIVTTIANNGNNIGVSSIIVDNLYNYSSNN